MHRRSLLKFLGGGGIVGLAGCSENATPSTGTDTRSTHPATGTPSGFLNREVPTARTTGATTPQFQGAADHTGQLETTGPNEAVTTYWRRTPSRYEHSQPVVVDDSVYISFAGALIRLALSTGKERWRTNVGHSGASTPAIYDGTAYITVWNGGENVNRGLAAVDASSGELEWRGVTDADITTSPAATGDGVFVGGGYETTTVAAFDHDGTERWRHELEEYASTPAVAGEMVIYGSGSDAVVAYDAVSGERRWRVETDGDTSAAPTITDGRVLIGTRAGTLYALDIEDGAEEWAVTLPGAVRCSVAVADGTVVVPTEEALVGVDSAGTNRWTKTTLTGATEPIITGETVYLGDGRTVRALSLDDGMEMWAFETRERTYTDVLLQGIQAAPTVTNGVVVVASQTGDVYALGTE
ncbi:outer membrane protein assembly factor BamB family protein [Halobellus rufus]|uniref:outer membrane protein assembly factor BamB family protein n=1 Tax=Halobellus rufus TaxID=1448860 RepID=UPI0009DEE0E6|nr:PQQ-binding-like beta-propeller repeat protein [Halobellus rufus]